MGGTDEVSIGHPVNGVPLCGSGTTGCHSWAEANPVDAELLGWRLAPGQPAVGTPFWSRGWGWRAWHLDADDFPSVVYVDEEEDLDRRDERAAALARFRQARPEPAASSGLKSQR